MQLLGINGSPRKKGNSDLLLDQALSAASSQGSKVVLIHACDLQISGCRECHECTKTGECVLQDDMQKIYPLLDSSQVIVLSTPVFFYGFPAQLKALIDRAQARWAGRQLKKTKEQRKIHQSGNGYLIAVGATKGKNLFEGIELTAKYFFDALDKDYGGGLFFRGIEDHGAVLEKPETLQQAFEFGNRIAKPD